MLDVAEAIFIKLADLMTEKGRSVRGIFTKYAEPEIFPDRTVLELLSPRKGWPFSQASAQQEPQARLPWQGQ